MGIHSNRTGGMFRRMVATGAIVMLVASTTVAQRQGARQAEKRTGPKTTNAVPSGETLQLKRGKAMINVTAYQLTRKKNLTVDDYTRVINVCMQGMTTGVDEKTGAYAENLMAWAHNKRGESYAARASRIADRAKRVALDNQAMSEFETAIGLDKTNWRAYHNRGVSLAQLQDYDGALADFDKSIEIQPKYSNAYFNRGECRYARAEYALAIADYSQSLRLNGRDAAAFNSRGHARYRIGQYRDAISDYHQAVRLDPKNEAAFTNRGDAYNDQGLYGKAATDYRKAIALNPKYGRAYRSAAWLMATCPDKHFRDAKKAVAAATKAIDLDGANNFRYLDSLAAAYASAERYEDAQDVLKQALTMAQEPKDKQSLEHHLAVYAKGEPFRDSKRVVLKDNVLGKRKR